MNEKIKNLIDQASSDGIITSEELKFIKTIAKENKCSIAEVDFYLSQSDVIIEDKSDYLISSDELIKRFNFLFEQIESGSFEGIMPDFPLKKSENNLKKMLNKGKTIYTEGRKVIDEEIDNSSKIKKIGFSFAKKAINKTTNMIPGVSQVKNISEKVASNYMPESRFFSRSELILELKKYVEILHVKKKLNKIDKSYFESILSKYKKLNI